MRIILEPAFVLHTRAYRDTSLLVDVFTLNQGRLCVIARNARGLRSRFKGCLVPFAPLLISASGKTELLQLIDLELSESAIFLEGNRLFNGLYLNELLLKLLQKQDAYPGIFVAYKETLRKIALTPNIQAALRSFELCLAAELGYGLELEQDTSGNAIQPELYYAYHLEQGWLPRAHTENPQVFLGQHLLAIAKRNFDNTDILLTARRLMRIIIGSLLGDYQLKTRELFQ